MEPASSDPRQPFGQGSFRNGIAVRNGVSPCPAKSSGRGPAQLSAADRSTTRFTGAAVGASPRRGRPEIIVFAAIGMVLVMAVAFGAVVMTRPSSPAGIPQNALPAGGPVAAASGAAGPSAGASAVAPARSAGPSASAAVTPAPADTPTVETRTPPPAPLEGREDVVAALLAVIRDAERPYRMTIDADFQVDQISITMDGRFDVAGQDMAGSYEVSGEGLGFSGALDMVREDGRTYRRTEGGSWSSTPTGSADDDSSVLAEEDVFLLRYQGPTTRDGLRLHRFTMAELDWPTVTRLLLPASDTKIQDIEMELFVDDAGQPAIQHITAQASTRQDGRRVSMSIDMEARFSRWGVPVTITAPHDINSG